MAIGGDHVHRRHRRQRAPVAGEQVTGDLSGCLLALRSLVAMPESAGAAADEHGDQPGRGQGHPRACVEPLLLRSARRGKLVLQLLAQGVRGVKAEAVVAKPPPELLEPGQGLLAFMAIAEVLLELAAAGAIQLAIEIQRKLIVAHLAAHVRAPWRSPFVARACASFSRPRASRDITVPMGMPSA